MINRIRSRIDYLREQPEHVRLRAATKWTIGFGSMITLLWVTVLLPLEIKVNRTNNNSPSQNIVTDINNLSGEVAGIKTSPSSLPLPSFLPAPRQNHPVIISSPVMTTPPTAFPFLSASPSLSPDPTFIPAATP